MRTFGTLRLFRPVLLAGLLAVLVTPAARAGLFDDEEARRAILDLRARIQTSDDAQRARSEQLAKQLTDLQGDQVGGLRRSLLEMNAQIDELRTDMAKLRGQNEQLARDIAELQRKQVDLSQGLVERLRKMEPQSVALDGQEVLVSPDEMREYDLAMAAVRSADFAAAANALTAFQRRFPTSAYGDSVRFWLGNAYYGKRDYKEAIAVFRAFIAAAPSHPRAPEALLSLANCQVELKDVKAARRTFEDLIKTYPKTEASRAAKERLASLK